jgi:plasmid stabilization system protein ParE
MSQQSNRSHAADVCEVLGDVRRGKLRTFPYLIYYRVLSDRSEVIAVLHASRDPKGWQERVN